jgi:hypothetical protein
MPVDDEINLDKPLSDAQIRRLEKDAERMEKTAEKAMAEAQKIKEAKEQIAREAEEIKRLNPMGGAMPMGRGKPSGYDSSSVNRSPESAGIEEDQVSGFARLGGADARTEKDEAGNEVEVNDSLARMKGYRRVGQSRAESPVGHVDPQQIMQMVAQAAKAEKKRLDAIEAELREAAQERAEIKRGQQQMLSNVGKGGGAIQKGFSFSRNPAQFLKGTVFGLLQKTFYGALAVMLIQQIEQVYNQVLDEVKDLFKAGGVMDVRKEMLNSMKQVASIESLVDAEQGRVFFNSSNGENLRQGIPQSANTNERLNGYKQYIQIYDR